MNTQNNEELSTVNKPWTPMRREEVDPDIMEVLKMLIKDLPQLPVHVYKLMKVMSKSEIDSKEVARVASSDPGVVSKILKVVNSSYYGFAKKTENLHLAITILGFNEVRNIALHSSISDIFGKGWLYRSYDTRDLWEHSFLVSVCAETLTKTINPHDAGKLLTYGILHDVGKYALYKLILLMKKKRVRAYKWKPITSDTPLLEKEEALFGINHTIVGSMLAEKWELSEKICAIIEYHHYPSFWGTDSIPEEYIKDVATISISDQLIHHLYGQTTKSPEPAQEYLDMLGFTAPVESIVSAKLTDRLEEAKEFVDLIK